MKTTIYNSTKNSDMTIPQIVAALRTQYPGAKFEVFLHAADNERKSRVDIRRAGTYSPACIDAYCDARWACDSPAEQIKLADLLRNEVENDQ